jgi:FSR family fosmidomycin resistance protein-like MFS transporter
LPQFFVEIAYFSKTQASLLATVMLLALALGSLTGGILADRVGGATVMVVSMLFSAPLMAAVVMLGDWRSFLVAPLLGFASGAAWPPMLVMAQSLFPKNAGVGTGVALGFVFAMGGLGLQFTGWLAEPAHVGLHTAVLLLSPIPLVTVLLVFLLPSGRRHVQRTPIMQTAGVVGGK